MGLLTPILSALPRGFVRGFRLLNSKRNTFTLPGRANNLACERAIVEQLTGFERHRISGFIALSQCSSLNNDVNRDDFQQLAEEHLRNAKALLEAGLYSGAYYMCGYAVECALKACICARNNRFDFYPHPKVVQNAWSHKPADLIRVSGLNEKMEQERESEPELDLNWRIVEDWSEASRYESHSQKEANDLYNAISDTHHGVLECIKRSW